MAQWYVPIRIVELGRDAIVTADTKAEAIAKVRNMDWDELTDACRYIVTKTGPAIEQPKAEAKA